VRHLLRCTDRGLEEGGISTQRGVVLELRDPHIARGAIVRDLGADRQLHVEELHFTRRQLEAFIQHLHGAFRLLHLPQQLRAAAAPRRPSCPLRAPPLQPRTGSLRRTTVAIRRATLSARAAAVPGFPFVAVNRPEIPEEPISKTCTSAESVVPLLVYAPCTYE